MRQNEPRIRQESSLRASRRLYGLDPRRFGDFLAHDLWFDLDSAGRVLVRVSMEGEKDDIQFYFGRAFRSLKRSEGDMVRIFIDKVGLVDSFIAIIS